MRELTDIQFLQMQQSERVLYRFLKRVANDDLELLDIIHGDCPNETDNLINNYQEMSDLLDHIVLR